MHQGRKLLRFQKCLNHQGTAEWFNLKFSFEVTLLGKAFDFWGNIYSEPVGTTLCEAPAELNRSKLAVEYSVRLLQAGEPPDSNPSSSSNMNITICFPKL